MSNLNYTSFNNENNNLKVKNINFSTQELKKLVTIELYKRFLPEFLNRLDDIILFLPLTIIELRKICDLMIFNLQKQLVKQNIILLVSDIAKNKIVSEAFTLTLGARPLRRLISKRFEDLISQSLLSVNLKKMKY